MVVDICSVQGGQEGLRGRQEGH
ncbi:hypothetical protein ACEPAF_8821 [Sanghuangporus sanghuang]